ncbi:MAG: hypothetical protein GX316_02140 [Firmicutes bacterium]|nr:hypothetical protein [Bacillota bacterium]
MGLPGVILIFSAVAWYEVPRLVKGALWRELTVFLGVTLAGAALLYLQSKNLPTVSWSQLVGAVGARVVRIMGGLGVM